MKLVDGRLAWIVVLAAVGLLFVWATPVAAQTFDDVCLPGGAAPPCDESVNSLGSYVIMVDCAWWPLMTTCQPYVPMAQQEGGWDPLTGRLYSGNMNDGNTLIGRSIPHLDGDAVDEIDGAVVGALGTNIKDSDFTLLPAGFEGPADTREVHTELVALNLVHSNLANPARIRAGQAHGLVMSPGEVESRNEGGDFPAESFFDIYVEADLPCVGTAIAGVTVYNQAPLLVKHDYLEGFPPTVVYTHEETGAVPVYFKFDDPSVNEYWLAGDLFGWLVLSGHGIGPDPWDWHEFWKETIRVPVMEIIDGVSCCVGTPPKGPCDYVADMPTEECCEALGGFVVGGQLMYLDLPGSDPNVPITDPNGLPWHELHPNYCTNWESNRWHDNGDGVLSVSDFVYLRRVAGGAAGVWHHVEAVTITVTLEQCFCSNNPTLQCNPAVGDTDCGVGICECGEVETFMDYMGPEPSLGLVDPMSGSWHEIYPTFSQVYNIYIWNDNGDGVLSECDMIMVLDKDTEQKEKWFHVKDVAWDMVVVPRPRIPAVTGWGLAVMVLLVLAAGTVVLRRHRAVAA